MPCRLYHKTAEIGRVLLSDCKGDKIKMRIADMRRCDDGSFMRRVFLNNSVVVYKYEPIFHSCTNNLVLKSERKRVRSQNLRNYIGNIDNRSRGRYTKDIYKRRIFDKLPTLQI